MLARREMGRGRRRWRGAGRGGKGKRRHPPAVGGGVGSKAVQIFLGTSELGPLSFDRHKNAVLQQSLAHGERVAFAVHKAIRQQRPNHICSREDILVGGPKQASPLAAEAGLQIGPQENRRLSNHQCSFINFCATAWVYLSVDCQGNSP